MKPATSILAAALLLAATAANAGGRDQLDAGVGRLRAFLGSSA
mgnify:CR=1 FL=1